MEVGIVNCVLLSEGRAGKVVAYAELSMNTGNQPTSAQPE